ncbi:hypothetical protein [Petrachloros mirabilis]
MKWPIVLLIFALLSGLWFESHALSQGRTSLGPVGASMALLATYQEAGVLPPEGTPEANRVIQVVIQFQAIFMKSSDPAVREFFDQALAAKWGDGAVDYSTRFRVRGWTTEIAEALCGHLATRSDQERTGLTQGLLQFNMRPADFQFFCELYGEARRGYNVRGQDIHQIFTAHRKHMPGSQHENRKEHGNGNQGLHSHQS